MKGVGPLPFPAAIASMVRPEAIEVAFSARKLSPPFSRAASSRCLISSQLVRLPPSRSCFIRTSTQEPFSRSPSSVNLMSPFLRPSATVMPSGAQ